MKKISKSELSTPEFAERAAAGAAKLAAHQATHDAMWSPGESIWMDGKRGLIVGRATSVTLPTKFRSQTLRIRWDDGSMTTVKPYALNR